MSKDSYLALQTIDKQEIRAVYKLFYSSPRVKMLVLINQNAKELYKSFSKLFNKIEAAGGLVRNENGEFLMIYRKGFWDLPKGKLDKGETLKECAVREVEEECGIKNISLEKKIGVTYHVYGNKKDLNLKPSHWYHMKVSGTPELIPQTEESIEKAQWVKSDDVPKLLKLAYPSIKEVFKMAASNL